MRYRRVFIHFATTLIMATVAWPAAAQTPPAAAPVAPAAPSKMDCGAKPEHPGNLASDTQRRVWQREATAYLECYKKYVLSLQQIAKDATDVANRAIDDYNATIKQFEAAAKTE